MQSEQQSEQTVRWQVGFVETMATQSCHRDFELKSLISNQIKSNFTIDRGTRIFLFGIVFWIKYSKSFGRSSWFVFMTDCSMLLLFKSNCWTLKTSVDCGSAPWSALCRTANETNTCSQGHNGHNRCQWYSTRDTWSSSSFQRVDCWLLIASQEPFELWALARSWAMCTDALNEKKVSTVWHESPKVNTLTITWGGGRVFLTWDYPK